MSETSGSVREWGVVALSAVIILVLTPVVVSMMIEAWEVDGFIWDVAVALTVDRGYKIGAVVAVPSGLALGWILLFMFDESKRVQSIIIPMYGIVFALAVWSRGLWFGDTVDWSANLPLFVIAFFVGIVSGGGLEYLANRRREFKRAGWLLYLSVALGGIVGLVQLAVEGNLGVRYAAYVPSTAGLLVVLAIFVEYENERNVTVVSTSEKPRVTVVGGLCKTIQDEGRNHSFSGQGADKVIKAVDRLNQEDEDILPDLSGSIEFRYRDTSSLISRWISVRAESIDVRYINRQMDLTTTPDGYGGVSSSIFELVKKPIRMILPPMVRGGRERQGTLGSRLDESDIILMIASFPELTSDDESDEESVEMMKTLLERYSDVNSPEVVLVVTEAEEAVTRHEKEKGSRPLLNEGELEDFVRMEFMGGYYGADVVTVSARKNADLAGEDIAWKDMRILLNRMGE